MKSAFCQLPSIRLHFLHRPGPGPTVILVHGRTSSAETWSDLIPHFSSELDIIAVDLRGHGLSEAPSTGYSHSEMAEDLTGLISYLKVTNVILVGGSLGAAVCLRLALDHPELVTRLVLSLSCWTSHTGQDPEWVQWKVEKKRREYQDWNAMSVADIVAKLREPPSAWNESELLPAATALHRVNENVARTFAFDLTLEQWKSSVLQLKVPWCALMGSVEPDFQLVQEFFAIHHMEHLFTAHGGGHGEKAGDPAAFVRLIEKCANIEEKNNSSIESWDILNAEGTKTGKLTIRGDKMRQDEYHLVVHVWIRNSKNQYLISQRSPNKTFPNLWEAPGGSAIAGEDSLQAALREAKEEVGIQLEAKNGKLLFREKRQHPDFPDFLDVWLFEQDFDMEDVVCQEGEVSQAKLVTREKIVGMLNDGSFAYTLGYFIRKPFEIKMRVV